MRVVRGFYTRVHKEFEDFAFQLKVGGSFGVSPQKRDLIFFGVFFGSKLGKGVY